MSRWGRHRKQDDVETALANFALTFAKALLVLCVILFVMISEDKKSDDGVRPKVEAMIIIDWSPEDAIDVDTWLKTPSGKIMYYQNKEADNVFLDRDDLGIACINSCEEITSIRGLTSGEYILNIVSYASRNLDKSGKFALDINLEKPVKVHIKIIKMNPKIVTLFEKDVQLTYLHQDLHVVRFTIEDNNIINFNSDLPTNLVRIPGK